jgi:hypothetical protein
MKFTVKQIISTLENAINEGRARKVQINPLSSPATVINRMSAEDVNRLANFLGYEGISANTYDAKASIMWSALFYKIGEQLEKVGFYKSPFEQFYMPLTVGIDIEEFAPRIKDGLDRDTLSNSSLFTNFTTTYDSFYHRVNQFKVFAATYNSNQIRMISSTWESLTSTVNAELANLEKSYNTYIQDISKASLGTAYASGQIDSISIPSIVTNDDAATAAVTINSVVDSMRIEPNELYIPWNRNNSATAPLTTGHKVKDVAGSDIVIVLRADIANNVTFRTTLNTYFAGVFTDNNLTFSNNLIKVDSLPNSVDTRIGVTPGYSAVPANKLKELKGFICERDAFIFRKYEQGTYEFNNAATLNTSIFKHVDVLADISDRRKVCAIV